MWAVNSLTSVERCVVYYYLECSLPEFFIFLWTCSWSETWPGPLACWCVLWNTLKWQSSEVWSESVAFFFFFKCRSSIPKEKDAQTQKALRKCLILGSKLWQSCLSPAFWKRDSKLIWQVCLTASRMHPVAQVKVSWRQLNCLNKKKDSCSLATVFKELDW